VTVEIIARRSLTLSRGRLYVRVSLAIIAPIVCVSSSAPGAIEKTNRHAPTHTNPQRHSRLPRASKCATLLEDQPLATVVYTFVAT
jgi:hypothetical protein